MSARRYEAEDIIGALEQLHEHITISKNMLIELLRARHNPDIRDLAQLSVSASDLLTDLLRSLRVRAKHGSLALRRHEVEVARSASLVSESIIRYLTIQADGIDEEALVH
jgi:hypothetical protein